MCRENMCKEPLWIYAEYDNNNMRDIVVTKNKEKREFSPGLKLGRYNNLRNIYISSSSSWCHVASTDIPDPFSPLLPIIHHSGRSSGLHPVSSMYVRSGRPAFGWPYAGVHSSTSLMSSSLLLQQCPACLVRITCIVFVMGGRWTPASIYIYIYIYIYIWRD